jgi:hypothetical protein
LQRDPLHGSQAVAEGLLRKIAVRPLVIYFSISGNRVEVDSVAAPQNHIASTVVL